MPTLIAIPARYASTRFPGKPLQPLKGATGISKTLIERSWKAALEVDGADRVVVTTDDDRIRDVAEGFGADVVMTSSACRNGTERCAEVAAQCPDYDIIVNLQGDAPLTPPWFVEPLITSLRDTQEISVATPVLRCDAETVNSFVEDRKHDRVGGTTAVFDRNNNAMYFSKEVIPYTGKQFAEGETVPVFHHVGVYAYHADALREYIKWPEGWLEQNEGLEQLRFMENGAVVKCVEVSAKGRKFWELNNPVDVSRIEKIMQEQGIE